MELDMGYVYKITNTVNQKAYIGISIHEPEKRRIRDHLSGYGNRIIAEAVKKYGRDAFTYEVLEKNVFPELLPDLEVAYIEKFNTVAPNGYNLTHGGEVAKRPSAETLHKMSEIHKGEKHYNFGKTLSADHRLKISKANSGEKHYNFGKTLPKKTRQKISEAKRQPRHPDYNLAHSYFFFLSPELSLTEKRRLMYSKFPNIGKDTIRKWVRKWILTA